MARTIRHAIAGIVLLLCAAQTAMSCSVRSMELKRVPQDLAVSITHDKVPIAGIEVKVVKKNTTDPVFTGVTDEHGAVVIHGLAAGQYTLSASHLGFSAGEEWIEVITGSDEKLQGHFSFEWNSDFQTSRIAGTLSGRIPGNTGHPLMDIIHPRETVFGGVGITLRNAFGVEEYRTFSDSTGGFEMDNVPDGVYILTIAGGMKAISGTADVTSRIVDVRSSAKRSTLPFQLRDTGCYHTEFELQGE